MQRLFKQKSKEKKKIAAKERRHPGRKRERERERAINTDVKRERIEACRRVASRFQTSLHEPREIYIYACTTTTCFS